MRMWIKSLYSPFILLVQVEWISTALALVTCSFPREALKGLSSVSPSVCYPIFSLRCLKTLLLNYSHPMWQWLSQRVLILPLSPSMMYLIHKVEILELISHKNYYKESTVIHTTWWTKLSRYMCYAACMVFDMNIIIIMHDLNGSYMVGCQWRWREERENELNKGIWVSIDWKLFPVDHLKGIGDEVYVKT